MSSYRLAVVMDPINSIHPKKDSTLAMLLEAQARGWQLFYLEQGDLFCQGAECWGVVTELEVFHDLTRWFRLGKKSEQALSGFHTVLMRKDPPIDFEYFVSTYLLDYVKPSGTLVVNRPDALRAINEKIYTLKFTDCVPTTLITRQASRIRAFVAEQGEVIVKPLYAMGGYSIFKVTPEDPNLNVILETVTQQGRQTIMAQRYIPEVVTHGDKRILMIDGEPIPYALARFPAKGESRANLAVGGEGRGVPLTARDYAICEQVAPFLQEQGVMFAGLDVIGDYLTEVNVTSPTGIRELDRQFNLNISAKLFATIEKKLN